MSRALLLFALCSSCQFQPPDRNVLPEAGLGDAAALADGGLDQGLPVDASEDALPPDRGLGPRPDVVVPPLEVGVPPDACVPDCGPRECGGDGCGGSCGRCDDGQVCIEGFCEEATREGLLEEREGYGIDTTGGAGGEVCRVTTRADGDLGSLRDCASREGPTWILFDVSGDLILDSPLPISADKTIDGRGRQVWIKNTGFVIREGNVIINHLRFSDPGRGEAAIDIDGADNVWLHHLGMRGWHTDDLIEVHLGSTEVTISWSDFSASQRGIDVADIPVTEADPNTRITVHHCRFDSLDERMIRVRLGRAHLVNNHFRLWDRVAVLSSWDAQVLSEGNLYEGGGGEGGSTAVLFRAEQDPTEGRLRSEGDVAVGGAELRENSPGAVFLDQPPPYGLPIERADEDLRRRLADGVGWQNEPLPP